MDGAPSGPAAPYSTSDQTSFAYVTVKDRWPQLVTGAIDDVHRTCFSCTDKEKAEEGKKIIAALASLKYEIQHDRQSVPLSDDGIGEVASYNERLNFLGSPKWHNAPWLFTECYLYRRLQAQFALSQHWKAYDVFSRQKLTALYSSRPAILELAARYRTLISEIKAKGTTDENVEGQDEAKRLLFVEMCEICLWGNATDLSMLTSLSKEDIQTLQGSEARKRSEKNILVNDLPAAYEVLRQAKESGRKDIKVDIILDNAGFELFVDLVLAAYLLAAGLASQIMIHPKAFPWFVSDVTPKDFATLLSALAAPQTFFTTPPSDNHDHPDPALSPEEISNISFLLQHWTTLYAEGQLIIRPNPFWTSGHTYWDLPAQAPGLFTDLQESDLVIFKGDLNYRKLTADGTWPPTTPFAQAIGPMGSGSGVRLLALRTCKSDVVVGLQEGVDERLRQEQGGTVDRRSWGWSGKWAVMQFSDGKK